MHGTSSSTKKERSEGEENTYEKIQHCGTLVSSAAAEKMGIFPCLGIYLVNTLQADINI